MPEIIPNLHPIFVHYTIALLCISSTLFIVAFFLRESTLKKNCLVVARWNLWIGSVITIGTVLSGWQAYNTVAHDTPSHAAMTDHRNWALPTAFFYIILSLWCFKDRKKNNVNTIFVVFIFFASIPLMITGFKGGEAVYRYGLGVMSLPKAENGNAEPGGHGSHSHGTEIDDTSESNIHSDRKTAMPHGLSGHGH